MQIYDLAPMHDIRKSFHGKARVEVDRNQSGVILRLLSYTTIVAQIQEGSAKVFGLYSQTTTRHIKEFLLQNGFKAENSKQIMADYGVKRPAKTHQGDFV